MFFTFTDVRLKIKHLTNCAGYSHRECVLLEKSVWCELVRTRRRSPEFNAKQKHTLRGKSPKRFISAAAFFLIEPPSAVNSTARIQSQNTFDKMFVLCLAEEFLRYDLIC